MIEAARFVLKGCPRCVGDLFLTCDRYGDYYACLQCGHVEELDDYWRNFLATPKKALT